MECSIIVVMIERLESSEDVAKGYGIHHHHTRGDVETLFATQKRGRQADARIISRP
jgi:hypothetical protein